MIHYCKDKAASIIVKSNCSTTLNYLLTYLLTQQAVMQASNDKSDTASV